MAPVAILPMFALLLLVVFVIIVLIKVCLKRPSLGAGIALAILAFLGVAYLFLSVSHPRVKRRIEHMPAGLTIIRDENTGAIWQPGVEDGFEANMYPSRVAAVRSLGLRIGRPIRDLLGDQDWPDRGLLFKGGHDQELLDEFVRSATREFPRTYWTTASEAKGLQPNEVGIRLDLSAVKSSPAPWLNGSGIETTSGTFRASVLAADGDKQASIAADYVDKPWIDNFDGGWNNRPNGRHIIAKSAESCTSREEAERQAIENACYKLTDLLRQSPRAKATPALPRKVTANDVLEREFILDRFSQKFDGMAGEIWRHALLIDASVEKMDQLAVHKAALIRTHRLNWAKMILSVAGLLALITVTYLFLNAATKGYYTWSLRVAGVVLAAAGIILFVS